MFLAAIFAAIQFRLSLQACTASPTWITTPSLLSPWVTVIWPIFESMNDSNWRRKMDKNSRFNKRWHLTVSNELYKTFFNAQLPKCSKSDDTTDIVVKETSQSKWLLVVIPVVSSKTWDCCRVQPTPIIIHCLYLLHCLTHVKWSFHQDIALRDHSI